MTLPSKSVALRRLSLAALIACGWFGGQTTLSASAPAITWDGAFLEVNGQTEIPRGMFGVHATPLDEERREAWGVEMVRMIRHQPDAQPLQPGRRDLPAGLSQIIECWYDRYQPALMLTDPDRWEERLERLTREWAVNASTVETPVLLEFWNEPYLNWASRPGVNYDGRFFSAENREVGGPVWDRDGEKIDGLEWTRAIRAVNAAGAPDYLASRYIPGRIDGRAPEAGDVFDFRGQPRRLEEFWWVRDTEQPEFWSGPFNRELYHRMLAVVAPTLKEVNPDLQLLAGWDFHFQQAGWRAWEILHRPLLDRFGPYLDGITEHHYGIDTRFVAASYEVLDSYMRTEHNRVIRFFNTEAGGFLDPEQPNPNARPQYHANTPEEFWGTMTYSFRDILHLLALSPDKAASRAAHAADRSGDRYALPFLRELRGRLIAVESDDPQIWVVGAYDADRGQIAIYAFSDHTGEDREVEVSWSLPDGFSVGDVRRATPRRNERGDIDWPEKVLPWPGEGTFSEKVSLAPRSATRWIIPVTEVEEGVSHRQVVHRQQYFPAILKTVPSGGEVHWDIPGPVDLGEDAVSRQLDPLFRWVYWSYVPGTASWTINGDAWSPPHYRPGVLNVGSIPGLDWKRDNVLRLQLNEEEAARFSLQTMSVVWRWQETIAIP